MRTTQGIYALIGDNGIATMLFVRLHMAAGLAARCETGFASTSLHVLKKKREILSNWTTRSAHNFLQRPNLQVKTPLFSFTF
jgi:hypothetical protein